MIDTDETLLTELKVSDAHEAWRKFYDLYWSPIMRYAQKLGLSHAQAQDVLQETMITLMRVLPAFVYDRAQGRFRNFMLTIVHRRALSVRRRGARDSHVPFETERDEAEALDGHYGANGTNGSAVDEGAVSLWRESLIEEALQKLRSDPGIDGRTVDIFFAYAVERRPAIDVAQQFGMKENAIYQIKNRVVRRLQTEVSQLLRNSGA